MSIASPSPIQITKKQQRKLQFSLTKPNFISQFNNNKYAIQLNRKAQTPTRRSFPNQTLIRNKSRTPINENTPKTIFTKKGCGTTLKAIHVNIKQLPSQRTFNNVKQKSKKIIKAMPSHVLTHKTNSLSYSHLSSSRNNEHDEGVKRVITKSRSPSANNIWKSGSSNSKSNNKHIMKYNNNNNTNDLSSSSSMTTHNNNNNSSSNRNSNYKCKTNVEKIKIRRRILSPTLMDSNNTVVNKTISSNPRFIDGSSSNKKYNHNSSNHHKQLSDFTISPNIKNNKTKPSSTIKTSSSLTTKNTIKSKSPILSTTKTHNKSRHTTTIVKKANSISVPIHPKHKEPHFLLSNTNTKDINRISISQSINPIKINKTPKKEYPNRVSLFLDKANNDQQPLHNKLPHKKLGISKSTTSIKLITKLESITKKGFSGQGIKKVNQDNLFIYPNLNNEPTTIYIGVCDGHGINGHEVSQYISLSLPKQMHNQFQLKNIPNISTYNSKKLHAIISDVFIKLNSEIILNKSIDTTFSGSTCVSLILTPTKLICANAGDSRCIVGKYTPHNNNWFSRELSHDHKPHINEEKQRIILSGGRIEAYKDENGNYIGPERVWVCNGDVPGLAMSRSFGDDVAQSVGVISSPEIIEMDIKDEDKFIVIASDGVWEFISSQECVDIVKDFYIQNDAQGAVSFLYKEASRRWIMEEEVIDDITVIIGFLQ